MIVLNTNGKYEYSSFCTKSKSDEAERWLDKYKDFIVQHRENIIVEFDLERKTANIHLSTIPSERKDINGSPCDISLTAIGADINGSDYNVMLSLIVYALSEGFDALGGIMDTHFKEEFFNVKNQDDIQSFDKEELVNYKLNDLYEKHTKCVQPQTILDLPKIEKDTCAAKSVKAVNVADFVSAIQYVHNDKEATKFILIITRMSVTDEKVKKFAHKDDKKFAKAVIYRTSALEETDWQSYVIKKKTLPLSAKIGMATVAIGIIMAGLMINLRKPSTLELIPSEQLSTHSLTDSISGLNDLVANYSEKLNKANRTIDSLKSLQTYTDTVNNTTVQIDLGKFSKTGVCAISTVNDNAVSDTIVIRSNVDFRKTKKCYISIYKNSDVKPFKQIPAIDIKSKRGK